MEEEHGDTYLHRLATFIRTNEKSLAEAGASRRGRTQRPAPSDASSSLNPLSWLGLDAASSSSVRPTRPLTLSTDTYHLFYVLMRLEALEYDIGTLDVHIDSPSRPMSYVNIFCEPDKSETLSLASFRSSLSAVSKLSLGAGWWTQSEPLGIDVELKYIYSSFTKLPALSIHAPGRNVISELMVDPPGQNALPLDVFKNVQTLESVDIDPRTLLGWDRLAESLRSLTIKRSGLEDISDIFIGAVIDDQARREGSTSRKRRRRIPKHFGQQTTLLPDTVVEDENEDIKLDVSETTPSSPDPLTRLASLKWAFLKYLSLADNALTFIPTEPLSYLTSLTHLDLSSNLLISIPPALSTLYNLISLNLSDNMIDSVLGVYLNLGQILSLNLSRNRLESLCGLERLHALERVDLRFNLIEESAEVGRLATLPNISEIWIEGNPFAEYEDGYRVSCFECFWKEGRTVILDGTLPGFYEKRRFSIPPSEQMSSTRTQLTPHSPPVVAVGHAHQHRSPAASPANDAAKGLLTPPSSNPSPHLSPLTATGISGKSRRKQPKRIVEFDDTHSEMTRKLHSEDTVPENQHEKSKMVTKRTPPPLEPTGTTAREESLTPKPAKEATSPFVRNLSLNEGESQSPTFVANPGFPHTSRHGRYQTEYTPVSNDLRGESQKVKRNSPPTPSSLRKNSKAATVTSRSGKRRARVSASLYEPEAPYEDLGMQGHGEEYRRRIEALKKDMGDGWLKVFSELKSPA